MRNRSTIVLPLLAAILFACSDETPTEAFAPVPCQVRPVFDQVPLNSITEQEIRVAVLDAAERIVPVLASEKRASEIAAALRTVSASTEPDAVCRAIRSARDLLETQSEAPETQPDRIVIGLVLDLVETYYARARS